MMCSLLILKDMTKFYNTVDDANILIRNQVDKGLWVGLQTTNLICKMYVPCSILFLWVYHLYKTRISVGGLAHWVL